MIKMEVGRTGVSAARLAIVEFQIQLSRISFASGQQNLLLFREVIPHPIRPNLA